VIVELFDSHAHVDGPEFDADRDEVLARARAAGVRRIVVIGAVGDPGSAERAVALAERDPDIWATVATHPHDVAQMTDDWWAVHERLAPHPRVVAVGETGLDYYYDHSPRETQIEAFRGHVRLARRLGKPVVCHVRDAHADTLAVLREEGASQVGGVIHCFTGNADDARAYVDLGLHISFSGIVTFKGASAQPIREAVRVVPMDRILVETDAPYLAPVPLRGKRNEPAFVVHTAEVVAREKGVPAAELAAAIVANAYALFQLTPLS
jgi:TatD DNase family protein